MKRSDVEAFIALSEKMPKEQWFTSEYAKDGWAVYSTPAPHRYGTAITGWGRVLQSKDNAEFITQSRNLMPQLARDWLRMRDALEWYGDSSNYFRNPKDNSSNADWDNGDRARVALADIDAVRPKTPQQSLEDSLKEMKAIRSGELPARTWAEFQSELDVEDTWTLKKIVEQLESCGYECIAGPLRNNVALIALKGMAQGSGADAEDGASDETSSLPIQRT